jgi:hypothetical protein
MRIALTGATGFVGHALGAHLAERGHEVLALVRRGSDGDAPTGITPRGYDPLDVASVRTALEGAEAVVNLAGRPLLASRWNEKVKATLWDSRIKTTQALVEAMTDLSPVPRTLISASAVGYYGPREPDEFLTEEARPGSDFLAQLCVAWEAAAQRAAGGPTRVVCLRLGIVLGKGGGALAQMETPFKLGLGGRVGSGHQVMSWIHRTDVCRLVAFMLEHKEIEGAVNATAPNPVSNRVFTKALGRALERPTVLPVPSFVLRLRFGAGAVAVVTGQRALPHVATEHGFTFEHPAVDGALSDVYD